jgi:hypothetical protein
MGTDRKIFHNLGKTKRLALICSCTGTGGMNPDSYKKYTPDQRLMNLDNGGLKSLPKDLSRKKNSQDFRNYSSDKLKG